jgi:hypothetical protein
MKKKKPPSVMIVSTSRKPDRITLLIDGQRKTFEANPYDVEKIQRRLKHNVGRALAYVRKLKQIAD